MKYLLGLHQNLYHQRVVHCLLKDQLMFALSVVSVRSLIVNGIPHEPTFKENYEYYFDKYI